MENFLFIYLFIYLLFTFENIVSMGQWEKKHLKLMVNSTDENNYIKNADIHYRAIHRARPFLQILREKS